MGLKPRIAAPTAVRRLRRRLSKSKRKPPPQVSSHIADKLEALRSLIPPQNAETVKPDQLFRQTADYIVLLETQVLVLQKLVDLYGSQPQSQSQSQSEKNPDAVQ